ncbi:MAG: right-handed parallel beta-helix repeat-containing protein, partial [Thermoleophilia bacterium]|nr:right-handed parallel beta-helix repeat-containing protein [Thermoleophilia bacterium]
EQRHGVFISRGKNITSQRLLVRNTSGDGIFYYGGSSGLIEGCTVVGGAVPKNARVGINFQGAAGLVVRNNTVTNYDTSFKAEIDSGAPDATDVQILNNTASGGYPLALNGSSTGGKCRRFVIEGNTFTARPGADWNIWVGHAYDTVIRNNTLSGGYSGVYVIFDAHNVVIQGNRFLDQRVGVQLSNYENIGASDGITITYNTFRAANPAVNVSANYANVEVAFNGYPAGATLITNTSLVTGLLVHDNVVGEAPSPESTTTTQPALTTTTTEPLSTTTTRPPATTTTTPPLTEASAQPINNTRLTTTTTVQTPASQAPTSATRSSQVNFLQPASAASVEGKVTVKVSVSSAVAVSKVRLYADGRALSVDYRAPWAFTWNTGGLALGSAHTLTAVAYNKLGAKIAEKTITVYVGRATSLTAAAQQPGQVVLPAAFSPIASGGGAYGSAISV